MIGDSIDTSDPKKIVIRTVVPAALFTFADEHDQYMRRHSEAVGRALIENTSASQTFRFTQKQAPYTDGSTAQYDVVCIFTIIEVFS